MPCVAPGYGPDARRTDVARQEAVGRVAPDRRAHRPRRPPPHQLLRTLLVLLPALGWVASVPTAGSPPAAGTNPAVRPRRGSVDPPPRTATAPGRDGQRVCWRP